ncbi:hypothetical protein GL2_39880 [Microbulbifer sp. GL-2]|nr:hypothetical protein GL2_39880 [Microbulbifer sp. GL-2]
MKKRIIFAVASVLFSQCVFADKPPKIKERSNGMYTQQIHQGYIYLVDTKAELCFAGLWPRGGLTEFDCKNLAKRDEWKKIIVWVDQK